MKLQIRQEEKGWLILWIEGEFFRKLSAPLFRKKMIDKSFSSKEEFLKWFEDLEEKVAKQAALRLLAMRDYPSTLLEEKLMQKGISQKAACRIIEDFTSQGFVNDEEWVLRFIQREFAKGVGPKEIEVKLWEKKIAKDRVADLVNTMITFEDQTEKIESLFRTKYFGTPQEKVISSLEKKGFDLSVILHVANTFTSH